MLANANACPGQGVAISTNLVRDHVIAFASRVTPCGYAERVYVHPTAPTVGKPGRAGLAPCWDRPAMLATRSVLSQSAGQRDSGNPNPAVRPRAPSTSVLSFTANQGNRMSQPRRTETSEAYSIPALSAL